MNAIEVVAALLVGAFVLWLVFGPMLREERGALFPPEPAPPEETRRGVALLALKEIEFDRETGKLSDTDYQQLKARYSAEALEAIAADENGAAGVDPEALISARVAQLRSARTAVLPPTPVCARCGPRPEADALFCSSCGSSLSQASFCSSCGSALAPMSRFCSDCGTRVAA